MMINDENNYGIVLHGLRAEDFSNLDPIIREAIRLAWSAERVKDDVIDRYLSCPEITFTRTQDRSTLGRLNRMVQELKRPRVQMDPDSIVQPSVSRALASFGLVDPSERQFRSRRELLIRSLRAFTGEEPISRAVVQLKLTLDLGDLSSWRRVIVPVEIEFFRLHEVIQVVFCWLERHLHEFYIYSDEKMAADEAKSPEYMPEYHRDLFRPIINLALMDEVFETGCPIPMREETGVRLSEYLPSRMKYLYDFGDNWQVYIDVEKVIGNSAAIYPVCIDGQGSAPPEDAGGEGGYRRFLEAISRRSHPDYRDMVVWGRSHGYEEFDIDSVNRMLRLSFL